MAINATSLIMDWFLSRFGFQFVNYDFVPVRILHHGHVAARRLERFGRESNYSDLEFIDRFVKILHLEGGACSLIGRLPVGFQRSDGERVPTGVYSSHFPPIISRAVQPEHTFVEGAGPVHISHRDRDESYLVYFHFDFCLRSRLFVRHQPDRLPQSRRARSPRLVSFPLPRLFLPI